MMIITEENLASKHVHNVLYFARGPRTAKTRMLSSGTTMREKQIEL